MRVLRILPTVNPAYGGPVQAMIATAREMARQGWQTEALTLDPPDAAWLATCPVPANGVGPGLTSIGHTPRLARWIEARASRFDIAVVHGLWTWASVGGGRACHRAGLPYVLFPHGMMDPYFRRAKPVKHWVKQAFWLAQGPVLATAERVLFTAEDEALRARGAFWGPKWTEEVVIYGAAAPPPLGEAERIHAFRKRIGLPNGARYILSLGRLHPKKGLDCLIPAFAKTTRRRSHIRLVIAGPDPDGMTPALIDLARTQGIADRVQFTGPLSGDLKWGALEGADALALITHQENFGLVLAEALACATPVITTPRTNIWRELDRSGAAVLCDDTPAGATEGLGRFLALDPESRAQMRRMARDAYIDRFTVEAATRSLMGVLSRAAQGLQ